MRFAVLRFAVLRFVVFFAAFFFAALRFLAMVMSCEVLILSTHSRKILHTNVSTK
jgi:hypothetical protein